MENNRGHILAEIIDKRCFGAVPVVLDANGVDIDEFLVEGWQRHLWKIFQMDVK